VHGVNVCPALDLTLNQRICEPCLFHAVNHSFNFVIWFNGIHHFKRSI